MIFSNNRPYSFSTRKFIRVIPWFFLIALSAAPGRAEETSVSSDPTPAAATPRPQPTASEPAKIQVNGESSKTLVIHKPRPSSSWGKVIQYHRQEVLPLSDKNREILHEFLFQDDQGVVRTAIFHENAFGDGYWEVYVWDQP